MKKKIITTMLAICMAIAMCFTLVACGDKGGSGNNDNDKNQTTNKIATPTEFSISDNTYSFKGVENADYYQINFYTSAEAEDYAYTLPSISANASKTTYSGTITTVPAGTYTVKLFAYDADDEASDPAVISCDITVELSSPTIEYWYDATLKKLDLQLFNFDVYQNESTPEVEVTLTNLDTNAESKKSFTVDAINDALNNLSGERSDYPYVEFDVEHGKYSVKATAVAKTELASTSDEVLAFGEIELGIINKKSEGFDAVWASNVVADSVSALDVTVNDEILLSSENSTRTQIADGALMNFRYMQANDSGRKTGFKRDFGYGITIIKDTTVQEGCVYSYSLAYNQGTNNGTGYLYLKQDGSVEFKLNPPDSGVPVGGTFTGSWVYTDDSRQTVAINISNDNLVNKFATVA